MREPRINIKRSDLIFVLNKVLGYQVADKIDAIFKAAKPYQIRDGFIVYAKSPNIKKAAKSVKADTPFVEQFNRILTASRLSAQHRFIQTIKKDDISYNTLQEITKDAIEFCDLYKFVYDKGFKLYCETGLRLMGKKYGLSRFKSLKHKIFEAAEATIILTDLPENVEQLSKDINVYYVGKCAALNIAVTINSPERLVNLVFAAYEALEYKANAQRWVDAQFLGLEWTNTLPELTQLYGDNAKLRYEKYCSINHIKVNQSDAISVYGSEEEKRYWDSIRKNKAT